MSPDIDIAPATHGRSGSLRPALRSHRLKRDLIRFVFGLLVPAVLVGCGTDADSSASEASGATADVPEDRRVALVTGSTSGLGEEVARRLAAVGMHVIVHGRSEERGMALVREIEDSGVGSASFHAADLASLEQVRELARVVLSEYDRLDLLVNNAGIGSARDGREESEDGYELVFQVNYLSHFLLTDLLKPRLVESAPARIVNVASVAQSPIDFDDVMLEEEGAIGRAYGQSKLAQILHAFDLAEELEGTGVIVSALHPATFMDTGMVRRAGVEPRATVDEGADAVMQLLTEPIESGQYFNGLQPATANDQAYDESARDRLRELSRELVGLPPAG
ncbi:MAG: SDR family oxidoreductase [Gemmatimonadales bacterium]|nr:MAG: SDR family oxidoreductase [Gemmatimonadales bacterium]